MDTNVHKEVLRNGDMETGCTIHFVTEEVDAGPILIQKKCAVTGEDTVESLKTKVQQLEGMAFIEAIEMIANKY
jgi:phosphoribosylglycinamide formyltransferase-1